MTDDERRAERRRRMDELLAQADADVTRTRASQKQPAGTPVVDQRRSSFWGSLLGVLILLTLAAGFALTAITIGRFSGPDYNDADRRGTATVETCQRRGPITLKGFGYYDRCTVDITWTNGAGPRVVIDEPGFMKGEKPGATFQIGLNTGSRGSHGYSRPELPSRAWVTWLSILLGFVAFLCVGAVYLFLRQTAKDLRRRQR